MERVSLARLARNGVILVAAAVALVLVLRVVAAVVLVTNFGPDQERYARAAAAAGLAHAGMLDQETGLRAFLATHEQSFLDSYSVGQRELAEGNLELASAAGSDRRLAPDVRAVASAQQRWLDGWALPALSSADVASGAILPEFLTRGKLLFDDYRKIQGRLQADIDAEQVASLRFENTMLLLASLIEVGFLVTAVVFSAFGLRRLRAEVIHPVSRLAAGLEELAAGNYDSRVEGGGRVVEFAPLNAGVDRLAETLSALSLAVRNREQDAEAQATRLRHLLELTRDIAGSLSLRYILRSVGESAIKVSPYDVTVVWLVDEERRTLVPSYLSCGPDGQPLGLDPIEIGSSLPGLAAKFGQAFRRAARADPPSGYQPELTVDAIAVPMIVGARCIGVIELASIEPSPAGEVDLPLIETLAIHAGSAIEAARLHQASEEQAVVDALTRLFNRRRLDADLAQEVARAVRYQRPLAFVILDTDHFKDLNDALGHQKGDQVLQELAAILQEGLRTSDTAYRYGGEEFAVVMRETNASDAGIGAERLRHRIEERFGGPGNAARVTASFGVAAIGPGVDTADELVRIADSALYAAKQGGRNRVVVAPEVEARPAIRPVI